MNPYILFIAMLSSFFENQYFHWNMTAQSDSEMICDLIIGVMFCIAFLGGKK